MSASTRDDSPSRTPRYAFIDAIRGIAACLVMLQHSLYQSGVLGQPINGELAGFIPNWLELGEVGVVSFFLVSGFVIPLSLEKTSDLRLFWLHRALRIYPLYIAIFVLGIAIGINGGIHSLSEFFEVVFAHALFVQEYFGIKNFVGGSWTLSLEMVWYIGISGLFLVSLNRKVSLIVCGGIIVSLVADAVCISGHHLPMGRVSMLLCCVVGFVCYRYHRGDISNRSFIALTTALVVAIFLNVVVGFGLFAGPHPSAGFATVADSWAFAAAIFFVPFSLRSRIIWGHAAFAFLGRISYSTYLVHAVVLYVLAFLPLFGVSLIVTTFALTIAASTLTYRWIEAPAIRFGHSLKQVSLNESAVGGVAAPNPKNASA